MRRLSRLAGWCLGGHTVRQDKPKWLGGLVVVLIFSLAAGWFDERERKLLEKEQTMAISKEKAKLEAQIAAIKTAPQIRLDGDGYVCTTTVLRKEWTGAVKDWCAQGATILRLARTGP